MRTLIIALIYYVFFFIFSWCIIRFNKKIKPRTVFFVIMIITIIIYSILILVMNNRINALAIIELLSGICFLLLACLTTWNVFYSILWGFSGGIIADLYEHKKPLSIDDIISSYTMSDEDMNRMMKRRIPYLVEGGYISRVDDNLILEKKGSFIAFCTTLFHRFFSLGQGGGIKD